MDKEDQKLDKDLEGDEEFLSFDLDDISEEAFGDDEDEEIIELVNLVEKGPEIDSSADEDFMELLEEDGTSTTGERGGVAAGEIEAMDELEKPLSSGEGEEGGDLDLGELSLSDLNIEAAPAAGEPLPGEKITDKDLEGLLEEDTGESFSLEFDDAEGPDKASLQADDDTLQDEGEEITFDLEDAVETEAAEPAKEAAMTEEEFEGLLEGEPTGEAFSLDFAPEKTSEEGSEEEGKEIPGDDFAELTAEEGGDEIGEEPVQESFLPEPSAEGEAASPGAEMTDSLMKGVPEAALAAAVVPPEPEAREAAMGLSEEKLEAMVTRVVERVVRETMADVAERVLTEAIEALKQSIESSSE